MFDTVMFLLYAAVIVRVVYGKVRLTCEIRKKQGNIQARQKMSWRKWAEKLQVIGIIFIGYLIAGYPFPGTFMDSNFWKVVGMIVLAIGTEIHVRAKRDLGINWSNAKDGPTVRVGTITVHGLYRYSRNPMYTGTLAMVFGLILMTQNIFVVGMWFILFGYFCSVIRSEEILLFREKGDEYLDYCSVVRRFI